MCEAQTIVHVWLLLATFHAGQEYDPYSFSKEVERLDNMQKTLNDVKQKLHQANSMLNNW